MTAESSRAATEAPDRLEIDTAIIGGGVSGLYTAWRLLTADPTRTVAVFESSERLGGRLFSRALPGMPHVNAELGGMRYLPNQQRLVHGVVEELGLATRPFLVADPRPLGGRAGAPPTGTRDNLVYLRRKLMRQHELAAAAGERFFLGPHERGKTPDELLAQVMATYTPFVAGQDVSVFGEREVLGEPLYCTGYWNLLAKALTSEGYRYVRDAGGYDTNVSNANAAAALQIDEFGGEVIYRTLKRGMQELPLALARACDRISRAQRGADTVRRNLRLDGFTRAGEGARPYRLRMVRTDTRLGKTRDLEGAPPLTVHADHVVLAMPRRALELLDRDTLLFADPWFRAHLKSVVSQAAFKFFLGFEQPWWRGLGLYAGRSICDLPIRQTYYFETEGEQPGGDPANTNSLMMASYSDDVSVAFWKGFENGRAFTGATNRYVSGPPVEPDLVRDVTQEMVEMCARLVAEAHGLRSIPRPYTAVFQDWSVDPFGGGWHAWKAGFRYWTVMARMRRPLPRERVYICGEAYSNKQGWIEGALQTAEHVLEREFGLDRPPWLPPAYSLGP